MTMKTVSLRIDEHLRDLALALGKSRVVGEQKGSTVLREAVEIGLQVMAANAIPDPASGRVATLDPASLAKALQIYAGWIDGFLARQGAPAPRGGDYRRAGTTGGAAEAEEEGILPPPASVDPVLAQNLTTAFAEPL